MSPQELFRGRKAGVLLVAMLASCIAIVSSVSAQEQEKKEKREGYLGVTTQTLTDELREGLGFKFTGDGVLISDVSDGSPADRAGLRSGDVITKINTEEITGSSELRRVIRGFNEGDVVTVHYTTRAGAARSSSIKLAGIDEDAYEEFEWWSAPRAPSPPRAPRAPHAPRAPRAYWFDDDHFRGLAELEAMNGDVLIGGMGRGRLGLRVESLNAELAEYFKVASGKGVLVMSVVSDSPAKKAGIKSGDVITKVNDQAIEDTDDLSRAVRDLGEGAAKITLVRKGATQTVSVDMPSRRSIRMGSSSSSSELQREVDDLKREVEKLRRELEKKGD